MKSPASDRRVYGEHVAYDSQPSLPMAVHSPPRAAAAGEGRGGMRSDERPRESGKDGDEGHLHLEREEGEKGRAVLREQQQRAIP